MTEWLRLMAAQHGADLLLYAGCVGLVYAYGQLAYYMGRRDGRGER